MTSSSKGFTLVELLVVIAIVGILMAVALPGYNDSLVKSRRTEAKRTLVELATLEEKQFATEGAYVTSNDEALAAGWPPLSENGYYSLSFASQPNDGGYTLLATPVPGGSQAEDGELTLNGLGKKTWKGRGGWE